jgi:glucose-6-phosphate 1-epimerase
MHGVVRTVQWDVESTKLLPNGDVNIVLKTRSNDATRKYFPHDFEIENHVTFGRSLKMELSVKNTGEMPMTFADAQHNYFHVESIQKATVSGLDGVEYVDKVDGNQKKKQAGNITFNGNTDRVYLNTTTGPMIIDAAGSRSILMTKDNSATTVIWNPGETRARTIVDLGPEDWPHMLCVETANLMESEITLQPGQSHRMATTISTKPSVR